METRLKRRKRLLINSCASEEEPSNSGSTGVHVSPQESFEAAAGNQASQNQEWYAVATRLNGKSTELKGLPQWVNIKFKNKRTLSSFTIQFQGGFAGQDCLFRGELLNGEYEEMKFYPEDNNTLQKFNLKKSIEVKSVRFMFLKSYDFYGRIIIYRLTCE